MITESGGAPTDDDADDPPDPHGRARSWLPTDEDPIRPLMTLATVDADGAPDARTVLLSGISETGFAFHTDASSAKAGQLVDDPRVCLVVALPERAQQLVVQGTAMVQPVERSATAFAQRSAYLRQLAWLNDHELAEQPLDERRRRWAAAVAAQPDGPVRPPLGWIGFDVVAHRYVFWQGGTDLASHRTEYRRVEGRWQIRQLAG